MFKFNENSTMKMRTKEDNICLNLNFSFHHLNYRYLSATWHAERFLFKKLLLHKSQNLTVVMWTPALYCFCRFLDSPCDVNKSNCMLIIIYNYLGTRCMLRLVQYLCWSYRRGTGYLLFPPWESESPNALLRCSQDLGCSVFSVISDALYQTL